MSYQSYDSTPGIKDVWIHPLKKLRSDNGALMEYLRLDKGYVQGIPKDFQTKQVNLSWAAAGRINAFHLHPREPQDELWTVVQGQLRVWLVDCRATSETEGLKQQVILSAEQPVQLFIPAGVAHGYQAAEAGALLLYSLSEQFQPEQPNEGRLAWDYFGANLWEEDRG